MAQKSCYFLFYFLSLFIHNGFWLVLYSADWKPFPLDPEIATRLLWNFSMNVQLSETKTKLPLTTSTLKEIRKSNNAKKFRNNPLGDQSGLKISIYTEDGAWFSPNQGPHLLQKGQNYFQKLFLHTQHSVVKGSKTSELTARDVSDYALSASGTPLM